jgi:hypothetical protein
VHFLRSVDNAVVKQFQVFRVHALDGGIGHDRGRVVAHHAVAVAGRGPFRQETALTGDIGQSRLDFLVHIGIDQVQQWEQGAEGVPETGVGIEITFLDFAVVGTIVDGLTILVNFI